MKTQLLKISLIFGIAALGTSLAHADVQYVTCESKNAEGARCETEGEILSIELVSQYSNTPCIKDRTWGYDARAAYIWVAFGCRARFRVETDGYSHDDSFAMRCESINHNYTRCRTGVENRRVILLDEFSSNRCREGRDWDFDDRYIWVDNGCRGRFLVTPY